MNVYDYSVQDRKGKQVVLSEYKGKVLLIVNTATQCGFTPQYTELEKLYETYQGKGFEILDFPCNQFDGQAPEAIEEIHEICKLKYGTKFPQFGKVEVNGEDALPLYKYLKSKKGFAGFDMSHRIGPILDGKLREVDPSMRRTRRSSGTLPSSSSTEVGKWLPALSQLMILAKLPHPSRNFCKSPK